MDRNMSDSKHPFRDNEDVVSKYQILLDHLFDYVLDEKTRRDDFDLSTEVFSDPALNEAHEAMGAIMDSLDACEELSSDEIPIIALLRKLKLSRKEKLLFWLLLLPQLSGSCYQGYKAYLSLRKETQTTCEFYFDLMRYAVAITSDEFLKLFLSACGFGRYCVAKGRGEIFFGSEIGLRETIIRRCRAISEEGGNYQRYYGYYENTKTLYGLEQYLEQLHTLFVEDAGAPAQARFFIRLQGSALSGKKSLLHKLSQDLRRKLLVIQLDELKKLSGAQFDTVMAELRTECFLERPIVYLKGACDTKRNEKTIDYVPIRKLLRDMLRENEMVFCSMSEEEAKQMEIPFVDIAIGDDISLQNAVWHGVMGEYPNVRLDGADHLASKYTLTPGMIRRVIEQAELYRKMEGCECIERRHLERAVFSAGSIDFEGLATRIPAVFGWEDIELKESMKKTLELVIKRVNFKYQVGERCGLNKKLAYGKGVTVLLHGKPGTGKTMCAQVLAKELGMELYRVDISQLVSKYIGETEKNLAKVFNEANKGNIILFFDEADAIFSQRTEVNGTNDKYANAEVSFLLQKMEEYPGVAILATNLVKNFDPAVMRRLTYSINFEAPDKETILKLWKTILPEHVKLDPSINLEVLAENLELNGSKIKSILYNAAYMAAPENANEIVIKPEHLIPAIQMEFEKLGEFLNRSSLGEYMVYIKA